MIVRRKKTLLLLTFTAIICTVSLTTPLLSKLSTFGQNLRQKMDIMGLVLNIIERQYFKDVDAEKLVENSIKGMLSSLDPHTVYLTKDDFEKWAVDFEGYFGIGISYAIIQNKITVLSVNEYGPASQAGLKPGDRIVKINDESAIGLKQDEVPLKIMGPANTSVKLAVERADWDSPQDFTIIRKHLFTASVPSNFMLESDIGYIQIARFTATTAQEFDNAVAELKEHGMKKFILDLRGNQGGYLQAAEAIADRLIPAGKVIVYTKGRIEAYEQETISTENTITPLQPLIILIDHVSASSSEIVAGAVQDWDRGLIIGLTSFGKGLVQREFKFNDGSALLATIAAYYTPSGRLIQRDYSSGSRIDYYTNPFAEDITDSLQHRDAFHTSLGRTVYGGGGINPDITIKPAPSSFTPAVQKLYFAEERFFYLFCEEYAKAHPEIGEDIQDYLNNFTISTKMYDSFVTAVEKSGFHFPQAEFDKNKEEILFILKHELAFIYWGAEGRHQVLLSRDRQLLGAIPYFEQARELLEAKDFSNRHLNR